MCLCLHLHAPINNLTPTFKCTFILQNIRKQNTFNKQHCTVVNQTEHEKSEDHR